MEAMSVRKLSGLLVTIMLRAGGAGSQFALTIIVAALVSASVAGSFFFCMAASVVWANVVVFGLNGLSLRDMGRINDGDHVSHEVVNKLSAVTTIAFYVLVLVFIGIFLGLVFDIFDKNAALLILVYVGASALQVINIVAGYILQGIRSNMVSVLSLSFVIPVIFILLFLIFLPKMNLSVGILYLTAIFLGTLFSLFALWRRCHYTRDAFRINVTESFSELYKARGFALLNIALIMTKWGGVLFAGMLLTKAETAQFSVSYRLSQMVSLVLLGISMIAAPRIAQIHGRSNFYELGGYFRKVWWLCVILGTGTALIVLLCGPAILHHLGPHYSASYPVLLILVIGQLVNVATGPIGYVLTMGGRESDMRYCVMAGLITLVATGIPMSYILGMVGLALGVTLGLITQNALAVVFVNRRFMVKLYGVI